MPKYAILVLPAANRVYTDNSVRLMRAELAVFGTSVLESDVHQPAEESIAGVDYLTFHTEKLSDRDISFISNLSSMYALFEITDGLFRPIEIDRLDRFDSDLLTIQKYPGKTNELFTKLLLNVTALGSAEPDALLDRPLRVLDPLCGRGTTLNQAMMYGFDACGVETASKDFDEYERFIRTWLKNKRVKHRADSGQVRKHKAKVGRRLNIEYGVDREQYKAGNTRELSYVNADTLACTEFFRPRSFDLIVTDAPYGVAHGSRRGATGTPSRRPLDLLTDAIPAWLRLLRPGGAIGISWNTYVLRKDDLIALLGDAGLEIAHGEYEFAHRVDQAITRDLVVARKPG
ncbi:MAG: SAM-dependent methyltransferase [Pseudonocardiaceae bacterium]|nr:SAM-dependent methyltransferase [Pseudonocardiaceae bacterium]